MPSKVTFTGKVGIGTTVTAMVLNNVKVVHLDIVNQIAKVEYVDGNGLPRTIDLSLYESATLTDTISGREHTIVIST